MEDTNNILAYFQVSIYLIALFAVLYAYGRQLDIKYSSRFATHGGSEGNPLWRNKFGFFTAKKNIIWSTIAGAAILVLSFTVSSQISVLLLAGAIMSAVFAITKNKKTTRYDRDQAKKLLAKLREFMLGGGSADEVLDKFFNFSNWRVTGGRVSYPTIPTTYSFDMTWVPVEGAVLDTGEQLGIIVGVKKVAKALAELSLKDESEWFKNNEVE